jgi:hypothetical protein
MKKKLVLLAMLVCLLALGLTVTGCPTEDDDSSSGGGGGGGGYPVLERYQNTTWVAVNKPGKTSNIAGAKIEFTTNSVKVTPNGGEMMEFKCRHGNNGYDKTKEDQMSFERIGKLGNYVVVKTQYDFIMSVVLYNGDENQLIFDSALDESSRQISWEQPTE